MTLKQNKNYCNFYIINLSLLLFFSSCFTTNSYLNYSDPNYLKSDEFTEFKEKNADNITSEEKSEIDTSISYYNDNYYDYSFSSRIRRFHRPLFYSDYYGGIYTDYFWYKNNPFYYGTSMYLGYNWNAPYYSLYSYYPFYYENYFFDYGLTYLHYTRPYYTKRYNSYTSGRRGSLSSSDNIRRLNHVNIKKNTKTSERNFIYKNHKKDLSNNKRKYNSQQQNLRKDQIEFKNNSLKKAITKNNSQYRSNRSVPQYRTTPNRSRSNNIKNSSPRTKRGLKPRR